jgi:hypothetical protein
MRAARTIFSLENEKIRIMLLEVRRSLERDIPGLANVDDIDSIWTGLPEVVVHVNLQVLGAQMALSCEKHLNVLGSGIEDRGELRRSHLDDLDLNLGRTFWMLIVGREG